MAKDVFYRTKPHVNVAAIGNLQRFGLSSLGAHQVVSGQIVTNPNDRRLIAAIAERSAQGRAFEILSFELGAD